MEMVQEQRLKLKMKILLGFNMKIVVLWGNKNLVGVFFLLEKDYPRLVLMMELYWNKFLQLKIRNEINF